jgi:DNA repair protein RecN (Recombination protein N)
MISNLSIQNLAIIDEAIIELRPGMVAFTGETGAGKTMVTSALGLVLGDRADYGLVSTDGTHVEARMLVDSDSEAARVLAEAGGVLEDGEIVLARSLTAAGRSRAFAGGRSVPAAILAAVANEVTSRHGQNDQIHLRRPAKQREALDKFAGPIVADLLSEYRDGYGEYVELSQELALWQSQQQDLAREAVILEHGLAEVTATDPQPGELESLNSEIGRLGNSESLREASRAAHSAVSGEGSAEVETGAMNLIATALTELGRVVESDPSLGGPLELLAEAQGIVAEAAGELAHYTTSIESDPARLDHLQNRLAQLTALCRKYGGDVEGVLVWAASARERLAALDPSGSVQAEKRDRLAALARSLAATAQNISQVRTQVALDLSDRVTMELAQLSMPSAELEVSITQRPDPQGLKLDDGRSVAFGENGIDLVQMFLRPHPGVAASPLGEAASGGEMSRIMLAIEVVLAESEPPRVFVFDEVDAGVGGRAAIEVGRRLARLAARSQVLVVTHLPQVASFAEQQIVVTKDSSGQVTRTSVVEVTGPERARELSRMLSGIDDSESGLSHAAELLDLANLERQAAEMTTQLGS